MMRHGLVISLKADDAFGRVIATDSIDEAISLFKEKKPDVVIMDLSFSGPQSREGTHGIHEILAYDNSARIIVFSVDDSPHIIQECYRMGAKMYLRKNSSCKDIVQSIKSVADSDEQQFPNDVAKILAADAVHNDNPRDLLNPREMEVYRSIALHQSIPEIAERLGIGTTTVNVTLGEVRKKLGLSKNTEIALHAVFYDVVPFDKTLFAKGISKLKNQ